MGFMPMGIMMRQIIRLDYFWMTIESDYTKYARKCHKRQNYANKIHVPPLPLHVITTPLPFSMWSMDVIRPITPIASNHHRFILVATDYFTKWVKAISYANVIKSVVIKFLKTNIICQFRIPESIIIGDASNLNNKLMIEVRA